MTLREIPAEFLIEALDETGRALAIVFHRWPKEVEIYNRQSGMPERRLALLDHERLLTWIADPVGSLTQDDVELFIDYQVDSDGRLAITTDKVLAWTLSPEDEARLHRYL